MKVLMNEDWAEPFINTLSGFSPNTFVKKSIENWGYNFCKFAMPSSRCVVSILKRSFSNRLTSRCTLIPETSGASLEVLHEKNTQHKIPPNNFRIFLMV